MGFSSMDDIISEMTTGGKTFRADFMKLYGGGTVVAGRWYDLTYSGGYPPAYIHGNLVSNYDFAAGVSNWTYSSGFSWTAGTHLMTKSNSGSTETLQQDIDSLNGATYEVIWTLGSYAGSGNVSVSIGGGTAVTRAANGTHTETITAGSSNQTLLFSFASTITAATVDLVYVRRLREFTPYSDTGTGRDAALWHGGSVSPDTKHIFNGGVWTNVAAGAPSVLMVVDLLGCYPKIATNSASVQTLGNQNVTTNGTFTGNATGWTVGSFSYNSNNVIKNSDGTNPIYQTVTVSANRPHIVQYTASGWSVGTVTASLDGVSGTARSGNGTFIDVFTPTGSTAVVSLTPSNDARVTIDNVYVGFGLPRYSDGKGVKMFYAMNTANGANAQNSLVNYANQDGVGYRGLGNTTANTASAALHHISHSGTAAGNYGPFLPLSMGDYGIKAVHDFQFSAASASAGFVDLVLCKPLAVIPITAAFYAAERDFLNQLPSLPQIKDGACIGFLIFSGAVIPTACAYQGYLDLVWG